MQGAKYAADKVRGIECFRGWGTLRERVEQLNSRAVEKGFEQGE
jgi:hypothetical protein